MQKRIYLPVIILSLLATACDEAERMTGFQTGELVGTWINPQWGDSSTRLERSGSLPEDGYGIIFHPDQTLTERKNVGFCGTPPITYGNFEGTWGMSDSLIEITVDFWGGISTYEWKIISLDQEFLEINRIDEHYYMSHYLKNLPAGN